MRSFLAGIILFIISASASAQISGSVESIGFDSYFRPECWTPMVITITPQTAQTDFYQIHVKVQDLDRDLPIFQRTISVTGASETQNRQQKFRMYFIPPPTDGGLPDARDPGAMQDLQDRLKVSLHSSSGKWICDLPLTGTLNNIDPRTNPFETHRGTKLIVAVSDGTSRPVYHDNAVSPLEGVMEDAAFVTVHPSDLPENVIGYDAADAVVWLDADPSELKAGGDEKFRALQSYVRRGGKLIICQPSEWQKTLELGDLLPVTLLGVEQKDDLMPLPAMAAPPEAFAESAAEHFHIPPPPFLFARAKAKPNAVVSQWIAWKSADDVSPYLVRSPYGLGSVTWVAQDLGNPTLTRSHEGWVYIWNRIFDWKNFPLVVQSDTPDATKRIYEPGSPMDVGPSILGTWLELQSKSAWLITLAVLFFIGYWLIAGPGVQVYLATKKQTQLSWFAFGACAVVATALTLIIVKLVLRGPPELKHFSIVRIAPDQPAMVVSRMGIYIPRDGLQKIQLENVAADQVSSISALPIPPTYLKDAPDQTGPSYTVPIIDAASGEAASVAVPYRSTLKKFKATWIGDLPSPVQGDVKLVNDGMIDGRLTNVSASPLREIYLAFNTPVGGQLAGDWILYIPKWDPGVTLDLNKQFNIADDGKALASGLENFNGTQRARGRIDQIWEPYWLTNLGNHAMEDELDDSGSPMRHSLIMLSLFDRLLPEASQNGNRIELLRRGARGMDLSDSLAAGSMLVFAQTQGPLPMPLDVEGEPVKGNGLIFYQIVLPMDRSGLAPTTQQ